MRKTKLKRIIFLLVILISLIFNGASLSMDAFADNTDKDPEKELSESIEQQLKDLNFSSLEELIKSLSSVEGGLFGSNSFFEKVKAVIDGDFKIGYEDFFSALINLALSDVLSFLPIMSAIIAVCILSSIFSSLKTKNSSTGDLIHLVCYGVVVILIFVCLMGVVTKSKDAITNMQRQMEAVFPVLLTLMTAMGSVASASVYQPAVAILSNGVTQILTIVVLPLFLFSVALNFVGNLSSNIKLGKLSAFFFSFSKWLIGITFTVFAAFLSVQGITAAAYDGVSIRTARYALSHYIPIIGGYLSDGFNLILAGSGLIKNAVGFTAIVLLLISVLAPVLEIIVLSLCLKLCAAIVEPIADKRICEFIFSISKSLNMLIAILLGVAFMYFIVLVLIISTGNYIFLG